MEGELKRPIIGDFADVSKLDEAAIIARTVGGLSEQGLPERAFKTLLNTETLVDDAPTLVNATSVVCRRERRAR